MTSPNPPLPTGYSDVPRGKLVNAATCLEMRVPPGRPASFADATITLERWEPPDASAYRSLYRAVGEDWLWASRLELTDHALLATLHDPLVEVYALCNGGQAIGLLELDFRMADECELVYFGLVKDAIGRRLGRFLMDKAIALAWRRPIRRFWLHTCHFDHPSALAFYQRSGFRPYAFMVEVMDDPRLTGVLPRSAAPHVPLIEG
jgi:GNAT superfamily N-acetyltransferase